MLAGRKLLLADDSATIQKVVDLTFADEGVRVVAFGNGQDAIDHIEEVAPDIVLADVFMPSRTGYEVCEYVKTNEKLKHIPVMLLVGSFEPFDEAEARRVGADDILTKPFQSIRRLIDRVGALVTNPPTEKEEVPTAELNRVSEPAHEVGLNTEELEITTADTQPLTELSLNAQKVDHPNLATAAGPREETMETGVAGPRNETQSDSSDVLLDLGEFEPVDTIAAEDFVLELPMEDSLSGASPYANYRGLSRRTSLTPEVAETVVSDSVSYHPDTQGAELATTQEIPYENQVHEIGEAPPPGGPAHVAPLAGASVPTSYISAETLSPEIIDAIARRAVELLSDKVVREVAWEVVPDLAELLIKQHLEEKESQPK